MTTADSATVQRVVVMGGSSGIGEATATLFAAERAEVVITGRTQDKIDAALARIGGKSTGYRMDGTDQADITAFFAQSGPIDHLVIAVSGAAGSGAFADLDLDDLEAGFTQKFWPQVRILKAALPQLTSTGSVTLVTAASARSAFAGTSGLAAVNGALEAMVRPLAIELAPPASTRFRRASSTPRGGIGFRRRSAATSSTGSPPPPRSAGSVIRTKSPGPSTLWRPTVSSPAWFSRSPAARTCPPVAELSVRRETPDRARRARGRSEDRSFRSVSETYPHRVRRSSRRS